MSGPSSWPGCSTPRGWHAGVIRAAGPPSARVIKLGGSLLRRADWPRLVSTLLVADAPASLLVVGGGPLVDGLRAIDAAAPRPIPLMHGLAIDAMRLTARLVADAVGLPIVTAPRGGHGVLDVPAWLAADGRRGAALPEGWGVTSDSIAALVAVDHARGLVLAKTVPPPPCPDGLAPLSAAGWVDEHFPIVAEPLTTIGWCAPLPAAVP